MILPLLALLALPSGDPEWNRFRGPNGSGVHPSAALPSDLGPEAESLKWRVEVPQGYSSPVLTKRNVILTGHEGCFLFTVAIDRKNGKVRWRRECPEALERPHANVNTPCSPTAVTDGDNVIVYFPVFGLISYDSSGKERWRLPLDPLNIAYLPGTSPVLHGDTLLLQADQDLGSFLLAVDANTGEERWRVERPGTTHGFSSPVIHETEDGAQAIVSGSYRVSGYDLATGERKWFVSGLAWQAKSLPLLGDNHIYVHSWMAAPSELGSVKITQTWEEALTDLDEDKDSIIQKKEAEPLKLGILWFLYDMNKDDAIDEEEWSYAVARATAKNGLYAIRLGGEGDVTETHVEWTWKRSLPNVPSPILVDDVLYVLKEGGVMTTLNPESGETHKAGRVEGVEESFMASPIAAGDELLVASLPGKLARLKLGAEWEVLEVADFGEEIWATPAIGDDGLYVRTQAALYGFSAPEEEDDDE